MSEGKAPLSLEDRINLYMCRVPGAISGQGGHNHTLYVASVLVNGFALSEAQALGHFTDWNVKCNPPWNEKELRHKLSEALKLGSASGRGHLLNGEKYVPNDFRAAVNKNGSQSPPPKLEIDPATAVEKFLNGFRCSESDIYEASPIKPGDDWTRDGVLLVRNLFLMGELVNFVTQFKLSPGKDGGEKPVPHGFGESVERDELCSRWDSSGPHGSEVGGWMRLNPMSGAGIADKDVTAFRHVLLEFDSIPLDLQLSFFARLPLPISAILTSGGRSLHAWVRVDSNDLIAYKDDATMLFKMLSRFGVDPQNKNPSRLSRLVGVTRKLGAGEDGRQRLLYLNPKPRQEAICQ